MPAGAGDQVAVALAGVWGQARLCKSSVPSAGPFPAPPPSGRRFLKFEDIPEAGGGRREAERISALQLASRPKAGGCRSNPYEKMARPERRSRQGLFGCFKSLIIKIYILKQTFA